MSREVATVKIAKEQKKYDHIRFPPLNNSNFMAKLGKKVQNHLEWSVSVSDALNERPSDEIKDL